MDLLQQFFTSSSISALFVCVALGFAIGRVRIAGVKLATYEEKMKKMGKRKADKAAVQSDKAEQGRDSMEGR